MPFSRVFDCPFQDIDIRLPSDWHEFFQMVDFFAGVSKSTCRIGKCINWIELIIVTNRNVGRTKVLMKGIGCAQADQKCIDDCAFDRLQLVNTAREATVAKCSP